MRSGVSPASCGSAPPLTSHRVPAMRPWHTVGGQLPHEVTGHSLKVSRFPICGLRAPPMGKRKRPPEFPREVIPVTTYAHLNLYLSKFAAGDLGLLLLLGRPGTGKSESVKQAVG